MITAKYFQEKEFKNCAPACSLQDMNQEFINVLDQIREKAGIPLVVNCAYRTAEHEKKQGRTGTSSHTLGCAVDIRAYDSGVKYKIVQAALQCGITRIGIAKTFIHLDTSKTHDQNVIWLY